MLPEYEDKQNGDGSPSKKAMLITQLASKVSGKLLMASWGGTTVRPPSTAMLLSLEILISLDQGMPTNGLISLSSSRRTTVTGTCSG